LSTAAVAASPRATPWTAVSYAYGALVTLGLGYCLLGMPIQLTDSFGNMVSTGQQSFWDLVYNQFYARSYLRPFLWGNLWIVQALSGGRYFEWFRGYHVAQIALVVMLFIRLLRPRTALDAAAVPIGLAALVGIHTFTGNVVEAFPINTFLTILVCCLLAADLALAERRWWRDVAAALLLVFAALTVESGLLVAVVLVAGSMAGGRGLSRVGVASVFALVAGYFAIRFLYLDVGSPGLSERSTGFGFSTLETDDLVARFGNSPLPLYAYNVLASLGSLLFAEPRGGIFGVTRDVLAGEPRTAYLVGVTASVLGTAFIAVYIWQRRVDWWRRRFDRGDQLVVVFVLVALANAAISYAYTKDVIMSPAGVFYALALAVAVRRAIQPGTGGVVRSVAVAALLAVTASAWGLRAVGTHIAVRESAQKVRNEWAYAEQWFQREGQTQQTPDAQRLRRQLEADAIVRHPPQPGLAGDWLEWFEH
jgi:hypothetical protein